MRLIAFLALLLIALGAQAQQNSAILTCTAPTKNTDGTNLTNLAQYRWYWGLSVTALQNTRTTPSSAGCGTTIDQLPSGTWFFSVTAINSAGVESAKATPASKTITADPLPPTGLVVAGPTSINNAYTLSTVNNAVTKQAVGTVANGTPCDGTQKINFWGNQEDDQADMYLIPLGTSGLVLLPGVSPDVVFARCAVP